MPTKTSSDRSSFHVGPGDPVQHVIPVAKMLSDTFANGKYVQEISQKYIGNCHYDWDTTRLIWDGEKLIHHWGVWGYPMRLGTIQLKVAGIGAVTTREAYRKRGLMALAATDSFDAMYANGYDLSILRGRHYVKFGYARAWNYVTYRLKPEEIPALDLKQPYEQLGVAHVDEIVAAYNHSHQGFAGTAVRPTYTPLEPDDMNVYGWFDAAGKLAGYVRAVRADDDKTLQCLEAAGDPEKALAVLSERFNAGEYETLTFFTMPHQHPLLKRIRRGACIVEDRYFDGSGWRVKIVNLRSTLEKLCPVFEARLAESRLAEWQGTLLLDAGEQQATLRLEQGSVQVVEGLPNEHNIHGGAAIGRLLIGSDEPDETIEQENIHCTGRAADLARVLFPNTYPMLSHWDEY